MDNPTPPAPAPSPNRVPHGLLLGTVISLAFYSVVGLIGGAVAFSAIQKTKNDVRKGWNLSLALRAPTAPPKRETSAKITLKNVVGR